MAATHHAHQIRYVLSACFVVAMAIIAMVAITTTPIDDTTEVRGTSVFRTADFGTARLGFIDDGVRVALLDAKSPVDVGLMQDGQIIDRRELQPGRQLEITPNDPGTYEVVIIAEQVDDTITSDSSSSQTAELAPATTLTRLSTIEVD